MGSHRGGRPSQLGVVLAGRDFRRLYAVRLTSQSGDGIFQVALAGLFFFSPERAATARDLAVAFAVLLLPYSLAGPFAGVLLDRWRRRQVLVWANAVRAGLALGVAGLVVVGPQLRAGMLPLYAGVLACVSVNRFLLAGLSAALPHVVAGPLLVPANALSTTSGTAAAVLGAAAGFALRPVLGAGTAGDARLVVVAAGAYAAAALLGTRVAADRLGPDQNSHPGPGALGRVARGLVEAAGHLRQRPAAARSLAVVTAARFCYGLSTVAAILLYRNVLHDPADVTAGLAGLAVAVAAGGAGFVLAALVTPAAVRRLGLPRWVAGCLLAAAVAQSAVALIAASEPLLVAASFGLGFAVQAVKICVDAEVQRAVDDGFRGRVFSLYDVLFNVAFVLAAVVAALTLPASGYSRPFLGLVAASFALTAAAYAYFAAPADEPGGRPHGLTRSGRPTSDAARPRPRRGPAARARVGPP